MDKQQALRDLLDKVEAGELSPRRLDAEIDAVLRIGTAKMQRDAQWAYSGFPVWRAREDSGTCEVVHENGKGGLWWKSDRYTTSLDAALALHNALLPGWDWRLEDNAQGYICQIGPAFPEFKPTIFALGFESAARTFLTADLRALIAKGEA